VVSGGALLSANSGSRGNRGLGHRRRQHRQHAQQRERDHQFDQREAVATAVLGDGGVMVECVHGVS